MIFWELLISFFKIGLFSFGGGYAMITLIQREIESHGWMTAAQFIDIIAVAEMTPGPIAVNSATFVGFKTAGLAGGAVATLGVALPSLIIILSISGLYFRFQHKPISKMIFYGVRPVVTGLIAAAGIFVARTALLYRDFTASALRDPAGFINFGGVVIMVLALLALLKWKIHPILVIAGAAVMGIALYSIFPSMMTG